MRTLFITILLAAFAWATATETPMILRPGNGGSGGNSTFYAEVDASLGTISMYTVEGNQLTRQGSTNFLIDLDILEGRPYDDRNGEVFSTLRVGSGNWDIPTEQLLVKALPDKPTAKEAAAGLKPLRDRVLQAETEFWAKDHAYDGVVRAAMGQTSIMICVPAKHVLLFYEIVDRTKAPQLAGWRNYGADLYVPQSYQSSPLPQAILSALPADIRKDQKDAIDAAFKAQAEGGGAAALQTSDPWVSAGTLDRYVLIDEANKHIVSYEFSGKKLMMKSARNLDVDLLIPTLYKSAPDENTEFNQYLQTNAKLLAAARIVLDLPAIKALVASKKVASSKVSSLQATAVSDEIVVKFVDLHKIFIYHLQGQNNGLEMVSMRDNTVDVGLALQDTELRKPDFAAVILGDARRQLGQHFPKLAMRSVIFALKIYPCAYKDVEKGPLAKDLKKEPEWQPTLDAAMKACEAEMKAREERAKAAQAERDKKKAAGGN